MFVLDVQNREKRLGRPNGELFALTKQCDRVFTRTFQLVDIPAGQFVSTYVGMLLSDVKADELVRSGQVFCCFFLFSLANEMFSAKAMM